MSNFKDKTLQQITVWAWAAAVLPITSLACIFFIWLFGTSNILDLAMISGFTAMFSVTVMWWWWSLKIFRFLLDFWEDTGLKVEQVLDTVRELRKIIEQSKLSNTDK